MKTTHTAHCSRIFKRYDATCPRCQELAAGAAPRAGWNDLQKRQEAQRIKAIRAHDFTACAKTNVVCTHFDW